MRVRIEFFSQTVGWRLGRILIFLKEPSVNIAGPTMTCCVHIPHCRQGCPGIGWQKRFHAITILFPACCPSMLMNGSVSLAAIITICERVETSSLPQIFRVFIHLGQQDPINETNPCCHSIFLMLHYITHALAKQLRSHK